MKKNAPFYDFKKYRDLKEMFDSSCKEFSDKAAFFAKKQKGEPYVEIKYSQAFEDVNALGTALIKHGLEGKSIAIIGENRYEWAISYLSVVNGVGTVVPLDKELPVQEIEGLLIRSDAAAIIYSKRKEEQMTEIKKNNKTHIKYYISMDDTEELTLTKLIEEGKKLVEKGDKKFIDAKIDENAAKILLFTSGTTSKSKGVLLSHKNIISDMMSAAQSLRFYPSDIFFSVLPLHHTYECTCGFLFPLYHGSAIAYCEGLKHITKNMQEVKPTVMLGVPAIYENMYAKIWASVEKKGLTKKLNTFININEALRKVGIDLSKVFFKSVLENFGGRMRMCVVGAAAINPEVSKGFRKLGIPFIQGYGLTECSPMIALNRDNYYNDASAGRRMQGIELMIYEPNSEGIGEICAKGDNIMLGYYQDEEETKKVMRDGWFHTGDLGYFDEEDFLHITGRLKNVLITKNGKNVYPEEIESLINSVDIIKESMVYQKENQEKDDTFLAAIIFPDFEKVKELYGDISLEKLKDLLWEEIKKVNDKLVNYKHIKEITIREVEFEKTTTQKIKRYLVK